MPEDVTVPAIGQVDKRYVYAGAALVVGIVGYAWWQRRRTSGVAVDTTTGGLGDTSTFDNPVPGASGSDSVDTVGPDGPPSTNEEWAAKVRDTLGQMYDVVFVSATLGKYLGGQALTSEEAALIRTAMAYHGKPPVNPPPILLAGSTSTPGTPSTGSTGPQYADVVAGWHVDEWINDVRGGKAGFPAPDFSYSRLVSLNPSVIGNIAWNSAKTGHTADNTFKHAARYRVI